MTESQPSRNEWIAIGGIVALGFVLRVMFPGNLSIEHFDEGVYASNLYFDADEGFRYPERHLYAPPLLPSLIEWSIVLLGPYGYGPMAASLLAGTLIPFILWKLGRSWFSPSAGLAAAALAALSDFQILYSRAALTDILLGALLLAAVAALYRAYRSPGWGWAIAAGLLTGLCWWTKYNGWLPLAIGLSGMVPWRFFAGRRTVDASTLPTWGRLLSVWGIAAAVAFALWLPMLSGLQDHGGYASVAANHKQYIVGLGGWLDSLVQQLRNHLEIEGVFSWIAILVAGGFVLLLRPPLPRDRRLAPIGILLLLSGLTPWLGLHLVLGLFGAVALVLHLRQTDKPALEQLGPWLLVAWAGGLLLSTPLYRPFPRLTLPLMLAVDLAGGCALAWLVSEKSVIARIPRQVGNALTAVGFVAIVASSFQPGFQLFPKPWEPRTGLQTVSTTLLDDLVTAAANDPRPPRGDVPFVVYAYGEPGLFYHISNLDIIAQPCGNLDMSHDDIPAFLITGPHAHRSAIFQQQMAEQSHRFEELATYEYTPSRLVRLNNPGEEAPSQVRLYRILPR